MSAFFWWTAWAASTNRPGHDVSYTQNWPHEPLVGNRADRRDRRVERHQLCLAAWPASVAWSGTSPRSRERSRTNCCPERDPLLGLEPDAFAARDDQIFLRCRGAVGRAGCAWARSPPTTAWRAPASTEFRLIDGCPTPSRAPGTCRSASSGLPPHGWRRGCTSRRQSAASNRRGSDSASTFCSARCILVVVGSLAGEWLGIQQKLGNLWFWFGTPGL